jgi:hypothetical protein
MAERATGPVQPPVIDLTARAQNARGESETPRASANDPQPSINHRKDVPPKMRSGWLPGEMNWLLIGGAVAGGAVLGTVLTYLLAFAVPLPSRQAQLPPDLSGPVGTLTNDVADLKAATGKTQQSLDATLAQLDQTNKSIADVKAAIPVVPPPVDLGPIETEIKTLKAQIDAIGAGASGTDAGAIAQSLASVEQGIGSLTTRLNGVDQTVGALRSDLDAARKTLTDHIDAAAGSEVGPALKLPLILSGLESAFASGKPFQEELDALKAVMPGTAVPDVLNAGATVGLSRPDALMQKFETVLPAILAAHDNGSGDWTGNAVDWAKSILALRPAEEQQGDSPDAVVSRLEGAMGRRDYAAATGLIGQLPQKMRDAAGAVAGDIEAHAAADQFVADLRGKALATAETAK